MSDSGAIHLPWQLLAASYETAVTVSGLECFPSPCMDGPAHAALPNPAEGTVQIYTRPLDKTKGTLFDWKYLYFCKVVDLFM